MQLQLSQVERSQLTSQFSDLDLFEGSTRNRRASDSAPVDLVESKSIAQRKRTKSQISFRSRVSAGAAKSFPISSIAQIRTGANCSFVFKQFEPEMIDNSVTFCIVGLDFSLSLEASNVGQCELIVSALRTLVNDTVPVAEQVWFRTRHYTYLFFFWGRGAGRST